MQCEACGQPNIDGARFCAKCGAMMPTEKGPDPLVGQLVGGRFRVTAVLGEGGMGIVYVGEQQMGSTIRKVAIKTLHAHLSKDPSVLARFHRECGTVAQLEHPNTIKVYDFGSTSDGTLYIAMEFVAGRPLADVIRSEGALAPERVIHIMRQICGALDEAHQTGIIHRDLKPENVILTKRAGEEDFVKLLDFGIAARSESADAQKEQKLTQQGMVLGTPPYMSPEQFTGKALDARSDLYSLGVMAYEMLTGRLPFEADTPWQWATQHMTAQPMPFEVAAPSKSIAPGLRQAILRSLAKDREQRQQNAREFFAELSEGSRLTLEAAAPPVAKTGTMGMEAPPNFAAPDVGATGPGKTVATPMGVAMPAPAPAQPVHVPVPPPQARAQRGGSNKGLILGLVGVGAVLLVAMGVVAARGLKSDEPAISPIPIPATVGAPTSSGPFTIEPTEKPVAAADPVTEPTPTPTPTSKPTAASTSKPAGTGASPATTKPSGAATTPTSTPTTPTPSGGGGACDQCIASASSGNYSAAASSLQSCSDATKKAQCVSKLRQQAGLAAKRAAQANNCAQANAIITGVKAVGISIESALKNTPCAR